MTTMIEDVSKFGKPIRITYDQFRLGDQYRAEIKEGDSWKRVVFSTYGAAYSYFEKLKTGGKR